jgi:hypothetical protein
VLGRAEPYGRSMNDMRRSSVRWWAAIVIGTAAALLIAWLARLARVPVQDLVSIAAGALALAWLIVLVTVPWSLYFGARQVTADMAISTERGIAVPAARQNEASRIARRLLRIAIGAHVATAAATVVVTYVVGGTAGYYLAGFYLLSTLIRPAAAYLAHVRGRLRALSAETRYPREDAATLRQDLKGLAEQVGRLAAAQREATNDLRRTETRLTGDIAHAGQVLTADLARVQDALVADRDAARAMDEEIGRRVDVMVRRIEQTLDGISDHREVQAGLRALVRLIREDAAGQR